jgi:hypothetical protein
VHIWQLFEKQLKIKNEKNQKTDNNGIILEKKIGKKSMKKNMYQSLQKAWSLNGSLTWHL